MRSVFALFAAGAVASTIPVPELDKRQLGSLMNYFMGPSKAPTVLKRLEPQYNKHATRAVYMWGPFTLPPSNTKHASTGFSSNGIKLDPNSDTPGGGIIPPCADCTVHNAMANFAYKNGTQADVANGVYTHHIIIADFAGKSQIMPPVMAPFCKNGAIISPVPPMTGMGPKAPGGTNAPQPNAMAGMSHGHSGRSKMYPSGLKSKRQLGMSVFIGGGGSVGSGNPFSAKASNSVTSGYWIGKAGNFSLTSEIVNYDPVPKELYLTIDMEWTPGKDPKMLDVGMGALSADRCEDKEKGIYHPPKDKPITYKGEEWSVIDDGYFMNFTPHIHDGGVNIKVFLNGKEVCEARAIYGDESSGQAKSLDGTKWQTITAYTPCDTPVPIKKGDKVYVTSTYDLTKYRLRPDNTHADAEAEGMALVNFIFARPFQKGWFGRRA